MRRILPLTLALALAGLSCSGPQPETGALDRSSQATAGDPKEPQSGRDGHGSSERKPKRRDRPKRTEQPEREVSARETEAQEPSASGGGSGRHGPSGGSTRPSRGDGKPRAASAGGNGPSVSEPPSPESGRYTYVQRGWEEFCTATCRRRDLPRSTHVDTTVRRASAGRIQVVSHSGASEDRSMRTTSYISNTSVDLTKVELRYAGFSNTYEPSPAVRSLQLPVTRGQQWSSSWEADTSGVYSARVRGRDSIVVDGTTVRAYRVETVTHMRGQFRGTMTATLWIDPKTTTPVRTRGKTRITTDYGRFNSNFETMLLKGPGY